MATLHPTFYADAPASGGAYAERAVLAQLQKGLPDGYDIFHSVDWSVLDGAVQRFGEIDAVVVTPRGDVVLLEVKTGKLVEEPAPHQPQGADGAVRLVKRYGSTSKDVAFQCHRELSGMQQRLREGGFAAARVAHLLVLPGHRLLSTPVGLPRERIVDAAAMPDLCARVMQAIVVKEENALKPLPNKRALLLFLANEFQVCAEPSARAGVLQQTVVRLADGLATWVPRIHAASGHYVVQATAGSGKTQLALQLLQVACARSERVLYVCFNRPLADHIRHAAPQGTAVHTLHELAVAHWQRTQGVLDFADPHAFEQALLHWQQSPPDAITLPAGQPAAGQDCVVVDETQDMAAQWLEPLQALLKPGGRLYLLGDPDQALYPRSPMALSDAVHIRSLDNVRSPRQIVQTINLLGLTRQRIVPRCPELGEPPDIRSYGPNDSHGLHALDAVLGRLLANGVAPEDLAVLTFAGREHSRVLACETLADLPLRKFTGSFDAMGNAVWTGGQLLAETLYRFKGQAAPYVVLCEVDFAVLDEQQRRKLFVGMTRAQWHLTLVISDAAQAALVDALGE